MYLYNYCYVTTIIIQVQNMNLKLKMKDIINKILAKAHFKCNFFLNDNKKQHIFAETCLYKAVRSLPVMPSLLPPVLKGRSQVCLPVFLQVWWLLEWIHPSLSLQRLNITLSPSLFLMGALKLSWLPWFVNIAFTFSITPFCQSYIVCKYFLFLLPNSWH